MKTSESFFCHQVNGFDTPPWRCCRRRDSKRRDLWRQSFLIDGQSFNHFFGFFPRKALSVRRRSFSGTFAKRSRRENSICLGIVSVSCLLHSPFSESSVFEEAHSESARKKVCSWNIFYNLINVLSSGKTLFLLRSIGAHTRPRIEKATFAELKATEAWGGNR